MGEQKPRRALWWWLSAGSLITLIALAAIVGVAFAVLGASFSSCKDDASSATPSSGPPPSTSALQDIPPRRLRIYQQAGEHFDIDWTFLASIGAQECNHGECAGANPAGCAGPMQIAYVRGSLCSPGAGPTLWERYAVSAHPGVAPSVNDPADAIYTAARILREDKGAPPTGGSYVEYRQAACRYYGACVYASVNYADEVMARAVQYGFDGQGSPQASSPSLAQPISSQQGGCDAGMFTSQAASASQIVKVAESQVGQGENPPGSQCTIYGPCEEWCSLYLAWVWQHAGVPLSGSTALYGYSGSLYTWVRDHGGRVLSANARPVPGDAVFYGTGPDASAHVGIVVRVLRDGRIVTVEGNYANQVSRVGPFHPSAAMSVESAPIYGYAQPPAITASPRI